MNTEQKDEFGRDVSLRTLPLRLPTNAIISSYLNKYKNMSWADITYILEEEEEEKQKTQARQEIIHKHRQLYLTGNYEIEEGEELEFL